MQDDSLWSDLNEAADVPSAYHARVFCPTQLPMAQFWIIASNGGFPPQEIATEDQCLHSIATTSNRNPATSLNCYQLCLLAVRQAPTMPGCPVSRAVCMSSIPLKSLYGGMPYGLAALKAGALVVTLTSIADWAPDCTDVFSL
ncbi:hypothetical protein BDZ89DRAFT_1078257 [Hymenopellis radicata]|nr:hypothetical protein BDZ89DRAFT_1078257 [Hymenopellis radicata]